MWRCQTVHFYLFYFYFYMSLTGLGVSKDAELFVFSSFSLFFFHVAKKVWISGTVKMLAWLTF